MSTSTSIPPTIISFLIFLLLVERLDDLLTFFLLVDLLVERLTFFLIERFNALVERLATRLVERLAERLVERLVERLATRVERLRELRLVTFLVIIYTICNIFFIPNRKHMDSPALE